MPRRLCSPKIRFRILTVLSFTMLASCLIGGAAAHAANGSASKIKSYKKPRKVQKSNSQQTKTAEGEGWIKESSGWTRTIRAADGPGGHSVGESLALALDGQYLVLPWSFVADLRLARHGVRFFVDGTQKEIHIADVDVQANLALFKSEQPLIPSFMRGRLRTDVPNRGESLLVLASQDSVHPGARFVNARNDGGVVRFEISLGGDDRSANRYVFDKAGKLVAIAGAGETSPRNWATPSRLVFDLVRRRDGPRPAAVNQDDQKHNQLMAWQEKWSKAIAPNQATTNLRFLDCKAQLAKVGERYIAQKIISVRELNCGNSIPLMLGGGYTAGVNLLSGDMQLKPEAGADEASRLRDFEKAFATDVFDAQTHDSSIVNLMGSPECSESVVTSLRGQKVRVHFCTAALKTDPGLNDTVIAITGFETGIKANFAVARLKGFSQPNTRRILQALIENLRSLR